MPRAASARRKALKALLGKFQPLVLPGAYDAFSARLVERAGYPATYLGSFAAAASAFGLPDVGLLTFNELAEEASRIVDAVSIPVLADAENGFYDAPNLWRAIKVFEDPGVAGVHIEDNLGGKHTSAPAGLLSVEQMSQKFRAALDARTDTDFLIIARSDAAWVEHDVEACVPLGGLRRRRGRHGLRASRPGSGTRPAARTSDRASHGDRRPPRLARLRRAVEHDQPSTSTRSAAQSTRPCRRQIPPFRKGNS